MEGNSLVRIRLKKNESNGFFFPPLKSSPFAQSGRVKVVRYSSKKKEATQAVPMEKDFRREKTNRRVRWEKLVSFNEIDDAARLEFYFVLFFFLFWI